MLALSGSVRLGPQGLALVAAIEECCKLQMLTAKHNTMDAADVV